MTRQARRRRAPRPGPVAVPGRRPALEAVRSGAASRVLVARAARSTPGLREVVEAAGRAGVDVETVEADRLDELAAGERHQGVIALAAAPRPVDEAALSRREWPEDALVMVVDGVTDPHNLGAIARSAEAAGAHALVVRRRRSAPLGEAAMRASAGALLHLPVAEVANLARAIELLKRAGFWVVGLDEKAPRGLDERPAPGRLALVVGDEGEGLSRLVREACHELVAIPLRGRVGSLNVSVAAGVALFTYSGRRKEG